MPNVNVLDIKGNKVSSLDLPESLFAVEVNEHTVYEVVKNHLANKRQKQNQLEVKIIMVF